MQCVYEGNSIDLTINVESMGQEINFSTILKVGIIWDENFTKLRVTRIVSFSIGLRLGFIEIWA